jgi:hypothetical protein
MAVPLLKTLEGCADFSKTVEPFLPQLYGLPQKLLANIANPGAVFDIYRSTNPLISGFAFSVFLGVVFLVVSEVNKNYSQVDRLWSLLPTVYNIHYAIWARTNDLPTQRVDIVVLWSAIWSVSLLVTCRPWYSN